MAEATANLTDRGPKKPPLWAMRTVNRVLRPVLRSPLHGAMSKKLVLLSFTGRNSGRRYTLPLAYVQPDDRTILVGTESAWKRNLAAPGGAAVSARVRGQERAAVAEVVADEAGLTAHYRQVLTRDPDYARFVDVHLGPDGEPNPEEVRRAIRRGLVGIRVTLDEPVALPA